MKDSEPSMGESRYWRKDPEERDREAGACTVEMRGTAYPGILFCFIYGLGG